jgi:hypothetical protein
MYDQPQQQTDTTGLQEAWKEDKLQLMPDEFYKQFTWQQLAAFGAEKGVYIFPTPGLIQFLGNFITRKHSLSETLEICAGNGQLGRSLGIKMTDSHLHTDREWIEKNSNDQTVIHYPDDVYPMEALDSVMTYLPNVIIGGYVPHLWKKGMKVGSLKGVNETHLFDYGARLYIHIGNHNVHAYKPLLKQWKNYRVLTSQSLFTVSPSQEKNCIYIFER